MNWKTIIEQRISLLKTGWTAVLQLPVEDLPLCQPDCRETDSCLSKKTALILSSCETAKWKTGVVDVFTAVYRGPVLQKIWH